MSKEENKNIAIIGAGFIGLEAVEANKRYNKNVSVFQLEERILKDVFDKEITDVLEDELRSHEVNLYLSETITELVGNEKVKKVISNNRTIDEDIVIVAAGVRPNTAFIKNERLKRLPNGAILVDEYGRTSIVTGLQ